MTDIEERLRQALTHHATQTTRQARPPTVATIAADATRRHRRRRIEVVAASLVVVMLGIVAGTWMVRTEPRSSLANGDLTAPPTSLANGGLGVASTTVGPLGATTTTVMVSATPVTTPSGAAPVWYDVGDVAALAWVADAGGTRYWTRTPQGQVEAGPLEGTVNSLVIRLSDTTALVVVLRSPGGTKPATASVAVPGAAARTVTLAWKRDIDLATARIDLPNRDVAVSQITVTTP